MASNLTVSYPDLRGKVFIVTGAASGMGRTLSLQLAAQGANIGLLDLQSPDPVAKEITSLGTGASGVAITVNVQDTAAVNRVVQDVIDRYGRLDGAVNMAGYVGNQKLGETGNVVEVVKDEDWDEIFKTNLGGVKNCLRAEPSLIKNKASIVNAASIVGQQGMAFVAPYSTSKWAVIGLSKCAAQEVASRGILVNAVAPGMVETPLLHSMGDPTTLQTALINRIVMRRFANPEEATKVIVFLLSDEASYITGSVVNIDGGYE
ncbi:3-oxoacyl-reductase [Zopfia rhizophila CBS 207.26]|uniref:3-oxoacyl-reductase n=1 Tax=Zopfia rhizophila CBS 207.26 TaxID=1314779 RepID=A0A6A6DTP6_9PEZI|nr:3-oxoacyl-reductase [Zopfia rhizophila CBS 207.26]